MRIPVTTSLTIEEFSGGVITVPVSQTKNCIYGRRASGQIFATQRPGINIFEDASGTVSDIQGRGIIYWDEVDALYFVNNDTVYKSSYGAPLAATMSAGTERVDMFVIGSYLVILDSENNEGWYITSGASTTLVAISDLQFPPNQTPALTLAKGGAVLNKTLYVPTTNGELWNSDTEDPTAWASTDFIEAEINTDGGVMAYLHNEHIAYFGNRSIEFFYDAANTTGSPLNVRQDISYDIGAADRHSAWADADQVFFIGITSSGDAGVYRLTKFALDKISENDLDSLLTTGLTTNNIQLVGSGFSAGGRSFYILTLYYVSAGSISQVASYVYDSTGGWSVWELEHSGINDFPLVAWTQGVQTRAGQGILANGDIVTVNDDFNPVDSTEASAYVADGYVADGYVVEIEGTGANINMEIITGSGDFKTRNVKYQSELRLVHTATSTADTITVQWSDNGNNNYNTGRTLDLSNLNSRLTRCGRFRTRNFKLTYNGSNKQEIEAIEGEFYGGI